MSTLKLAIVLEKLVILVIKYLFITSGQSRNPRGSQLPNWGYLTSTLHPYTRAGARTRTCAHRYQPECSECPVSPVSVLFRYASHYAVVACKNWGSRTGIPSPFEHVNLFNHGGAA